MSERQLQFRVGLMVLVALSIGVGLLLRSSNLQSRWQQSYSIAIEFESAGGLYPSAPIKLYGLRVGEIREVRIDAKRQRAIVVAQIAEKFEVPSDSSARIAVSLLGEAQVDIVPGTSSELLKNGAVISGEISSDPMAMIARLETKTVAMMESFTQTSREWAKLGNQVNNLVESKRGRIDQLVDNAGEALHEMTFALKGATTLINEATKIVGDPETQKGIQDALQGLPLIMKETRLTVAAARTTLESMSRNMTSLEAVTTPLAGKAAAMINHLENGVVNLDRFLAEATRFTRTLNEGNGTLAKLVQDPSLYEYLNKSAQMLTALLRGAEPIVRDMREFSDKVARRPEILGVGGAIQPSNGLRDHEVVEKADQQQLRTQPARNQQPASRPGLLPRN